MNFIANSKSKAWGWEADGNWHLWIRSWHPAVSVSVSLWVLLLCLWGRRAAENIDNDQLGRFVLACAEEQCLRFWACCDVLAFYKAVLAFPDHFCVSRCEFGQTHRPALSGSCHMTLVSWTSWCRKWGMAIFLLMSCTSYCSYSCCTFGSESLLAQCGVFVFWGWEVMVAGLVWAGLGLQLLGVLTVSSCISLKWSNQAFPKQFIRIFPLSPQCVLKEYLGVEFREKLHSLKALCASVEMSFNHGCSCLFLPLISENLKDKVELERSITH